MAVLYSSETKKLYKNCNCGGSLPSYEVVIFRYGDADSLNDSEFSSLISQRRREERSLSVDEQKKYRQETTQMRQARRESVQDARSYGFTYGNPYYASRENFETLGDAVHELTEEELDQLGKQTLREFIPRRRNSRLGR